MPRNHLITSFTPELTVRDEKSTAYQPSPLRVATWYEVKLGTLRNLQARLRGQDFLIRTSSKPMW